LALFCQLASFCQPARAPECGRRRHDGGVTAHARDRLRERHDGSSDDVPVLF
jgi:hypothetical protein